MAVTPTSRPKVSVVIPAFNAELTISETLLSARLQTYAQLEIIVVDDGSSDRTCNLVQQQAAEDPRVTLIRQQNFGVAAARNAGAAQASGDFLAPLDADDIWYPPKLERQVEQFAAGDPDLGLVYTWSATMDANSKIIERRSPTVAGWVMPQMALANFIGNASSPLVRMSAFRKTGGYDATLRARNAQGLEDRRLYLDLAERYCFAVVPEFLTGYRVVAGNMSSDVLQMLRSHDAVSSDFRSGHPELASTFHDSRNRLARYLLRRALKERRLWNVASLLRSMMAHDPRFTMRTIAILGAKIGKLSLKNPS
jgi:glycosyltransferase involved in cell wall biosynthesis